MESIPVNCEASKLTTRYVNFHKLYDTVRLADSGSGSATRERSPFLGADGWIQ